MVTLFELRRGLTAQGLRPQIDKDSIARVANA